jgi:hypothetical protein
VLTNWNNNFVSNVRLDSGMIRFSHGGQIGLDNASTSQLRGSGGTWELRTDMAGTFSAKNVGEIDGNQTFLVDRAVGGAGLNQAVTFANLTQVANRTPVFNSRNGYGITFTATSGNGSGNDVK